MPPGMPQSLVAASEIHLFVLGVVCGLLALGFGVASVLAWSWRRRSRQLAAEFERLRSRQEELSKIVEALPDHVWNGEITADGFETGYFSPVIARITGRPVETLKRSLEAWYETVHQADLERLKGVQRELLAGKRDEFEIEYRVFAADGTVRWLRERVRSSPTPRGCASTASPPTSAR
jgi:PAS domain-containing protein